MGEKYLDCYGGRSSLRYLRCQSRIKPYIGNMNITQLQRRDLFDFIIHKIDPNAIDWDAPCQKFNPWRRKARLSEVYIDV